MRLRIAAWHIFPAMASKHVVPAIVSGGPIRTEAAAVSWVSSPKMMWVAAPDFSAAEGLQWFVPFALLDLTLISVVETHCLVGNEHGILVVVLINRVQDVSFCLQWVGTCHDTQ